MLLGAMPASSATPIKTVTSPDLADLCRANINVRHHIAALTYSAIWSPWVEVPGYGSVTKDAT